MDRQSDPSRHQRIHDFQPEHEPLQRHQPDLGDAAIWWRDTKLRRANNEAVLLQWKQGALPVPVGGTHPGVRCLLCLCRRQGAASKRQEVLRRRLELSGSRQHYPGIRLLRREYHTFCDYKRYAGEI